MYQNYFVHFGGVQEEVGYIKKAELECWFNLDYCRSRAKGQIQSTDGPFKLIN